MFLQQKQSSAKRAISLDLARGFMLLLIVLAHAPLYLYNSDPGVMSRPESVTFLDHLLNALGELLIDNRARPMFAVLFGYGMFMIFEKQVSRGNSEKEAIKTVTRRSLYLILFGFILAVFIGGQDILMAYGIAGILVGRLLRRNNRLLIKVTLIITVVITFYLPFIWGSFLTEIGSYGFGSDFSANDSYIQLLLDGLFYFPVIPVFIHFLFPVLPSVLIGIWAGRKRLLTESKINHRNLKLIAAIGIAISISGAVPLVMINNVWEPGFFVAGIAYSVQIITGIAGGLGYAALFGFLSNIIKTPGTVTTSLTALGKRSLTFFILNETLLVILLSPAALGLGGTLSNTGVIIIALFVWILSVVMASILEKFHINGPLESFMRHLVYRK
ncbi:DUF418 domain-containing protein [Thalassobacillus pellis]|uniref:DUF418 domain-containing protein n=1 Tax=Thalassobacillus pellis TaxID=748008 RepID=UPI00195FB04E|nr:DUF418 domain-containing protein [Thalassobacillus pellis]MBM7553930.1 putative membrane protein YeiB [Thalassobacillus pellis]